MKDCDFLLLTGGDVNFAGAPRARISGPIQRALFVALLLRAENWLSRDYVADLIWPESDQTAARQRLRANLFNLRQALDPELQALLIVQNDALSLMVPRQSIDVFRFRELAASGSAKSRLEAIALYQGGLLAGFPSISDEFDRMLAERREELRILFISLCTDLLIDQSSGDQAHAFELTLRKALRADRTNFDIVSIAMRQAANSGQAEKVLRIFNSYERSLREEIDVDPELNTIALRDDFVAAATEQARSESIGPAPPLSVETNAKTNALERSNTRLRWHIRYTLLLLLIFASVIAAWLIFSRLDGDATTSGPVFIISSSGPLPSNCGLQSLEERLDQSIQTALKKVPDSTIFIGDVSGLSKERQTNVFSIDRAAACSDLSVRLTLTVTREATRQVVLIHRYKTGLSDIDQLSDLIFSSIAPLFDD